MRNLNSGVKLEDIDEDGEGILTGVCDVTHKRHEFGEFVRSEEGSEKGKLFFRMNGAYKLNPREMYEIAQLLAKRRKLQEQK